jgi:transcriptional regulator of NAD metabolism
MAWEHFNTLLNICPNLAIPDPILLEHFYMGLNRKNLKLLSTASGGSFLHVFADNGRSILTRILEDV